MLGQTANKLPDVRCIQAFLLCLEYTKVAFCIYA